LKFLGHWVGDIHQPLHVSFEDDRGENSILVSGYPAPNCIPLGIRALVLKAVGEDVGEAATELLKTITLAKVESWTRSEPKDWANKSFAIAEQAQTNTAFDRARPVSSQQGK
jgi:S1/P1 Nuclease